MDLGKVMRPPLVHRTIDRSRAGRKGETIKGLKKEKKDKKGEIGIWNKYEKNMKI